MRPLPAHLEIHMSQAQSEPLVIPKGESTLTYVTPAIAKRFPHTPPAPRGYVPSAGGLTRVSPEIDARFPERQAAA